MAKIIAVSGSKGGTGKTTLSHLLAHGAGSLPRPVPSVVLTTDAEDELVAGDRRYVVLDARTPKLLADRLEALLPEERALIVVDGAAARPDVDHLIATLADVVLIPFGPSEQDVQRALRNLAGLPKAIALPNRWPTHQAVRKRARSYLGRFPKGQLLEFPFPSIPKLDAWLAEGSYADLAYEVASPARGLVTEVLGRAGIDPYDLAPAAGRSPGA